MSNCFTSSLPIQKADGDTYGVDSGDPIVLDFSSVVQDWTIASVESITINKTTTPPLEVTDGTPSDSEITRNGTTIAAGQAVLVSCSGGVAGEDYLVLVVCLLNTGSSRAGRFRFEVR